MDKYKNVLNHQKQFLKLWYSVILILKIKKGFHMFYFYKDKPGHELQWSPLLWGQLVTSIPISVSQTFVR